MVTPSTAAARPAARRRPGHWRRSATARATTAKGGRKSPRGWTRTPAPANAARPRTGRQRRARAHEPQAHEERARGGQHEHHVRIDDPRPEAELGLQGDEGRCQEASPRGRQQLGGDKPRQPHRDDEERGGRQAHHEHASEVAARRRQAIDDRLVGVVERRVVGGRIRPLAVLAVGGRLLGELCLDAVDRAEHRLGLGVDAGSAAGRGPPGRWPRSSTWCRCRPPRSARGRSRRGTRRRRSARPRRARSGVP